MRVAVLSYIVVLGFNAFCRRLQIDFYVVKKATRFSKILTHLMHIVGDAVIFRMYVAACHNILFALQRVKFQAFTITYANLVAMLRVVLATTII